MAILITILKIALIIILGFVALLIFGSLCGRFIKGVSIKYIDDKGNAVYDRDINNEDNSNRPNTACGYLEEAEETNYEQ